MSLPDWREGLAGIALFSSTYYILSANPAILAGAGMPPGGVLLGTFAVIILGNLSGAWRTGTGLMIAPALGISVFVADLVAKSPMTWPVAMLGCSLAGLVVVVISHQATDWRKHIIDSLPDSVRRAAKAAIGALLVGKGFELLQAPGPQLDANFVAVMATLMIALFTGFAAMRAALRRRFGTDIPIRWEVISHLEFVIGVGLASVALHLWQDDHIATIAPPELGFLWLEPGIAAAWSAPGLTLPTGLALLIVLVLVVVFIIMTDIPGTPPVVLEGRITEETEGRLVRTGFRNDSVVAMLAPVAGTTPSIYYAENLILTELRQTSAGVGYTVVALFTLALGLALAAQALGLEGLSIFHLVPDIVVAPVIAYVGLVVIALAYGEPGGDTGAPPRPQLYFMPAAIAVVLTPLIGLEFSFPAAVCSYWLFPETGGYSGRRDRVCF